MLSLFTRMTLQRRDFLQLPRIWLPGRTEWLREALPPMLISLTPFTADGKLDEDGLRGHYRRLAAAGIGVYVVGSGSGEAYTLSSEEILRILEIAKEELQGKVPVLAMGWEPRSALEMLDFARMVEDVGLDAMQIYSLDAGHGVKPNERELEAYLTDILEAIKIRCVISIDQALGYVYPIELVAKLVERHPNIIGVFVSSATDIQYLIRLIGAVGSKVEVLRGGPANAMSILALGGNGYLSTEGNLAPRLCVSLIEHYRAGRYSEAESAYRKILQLWPITAKYGNIQGTKAALQILGLPGGYPRKPRLPVVGDALIEISRKLRELGIRELEQIPSSLS